MEDIHPDLVGAVRRSQIILMVFIAAAAFSVVLAFVLPIKTPVFFGLPLLDWILFLDAAVMLAIGWFLAGRKPAWARRATALLTSVPPQTMRVTLRTVVDKGEYTTTTLYASLLPLYADQATKPVTYSMITPSWDIRVIPDNAELEVIADPTPGGPIIIRTPHGLLWSWAASGNRRLT